MTLWEAPKVPGLRGDESLEELREAYNNLANIVAIMAKDIDFVINGNIASDNAREIGGWRVGQTELVSKDGDVGMSSAGTSPESVRYYAGAAGIPKELAPFRVYKNGKGNVTGWTIESTTGYPKVIIDPDGNLFGAYIDEGSYISLSPGFQGAPAMLIADGGNIMAYLQYLSNRIGLYSTKEVELSSSSGDIRLSAWGDVLVPSWSRLRHAGANVTLQSEFDQIWQAIWNLQNRVAALESTPPPPV